jgi:hypothetical protein
MDPSSLLAALSGLNLDGYTRNPCTDELEASLRALGWTALPELSRERAWPTFRAHVLHVVRELGELSDDRDRFRSVALCALFAAKCSRLGPAVSECFASKSSRQPRFAEADTVLRGRGRLVRAAHKRP